MTTYLFGNVYGTHRAMWILIALIFALCMVILVAGTLPADSMTAAAGMAGMR